MLTYVHTITIDQHRNKGVGILRTQLVPWPYNAMFGLSYDLLNHIPKLSLHVMVLRLVHFGSLLLTFKMQLFLRKVVFQLLNSSNQTL